MGNVKGEPSLFHHPARVGRFGFAFGGQGHIVPASKEVEFIPRALAVAEEDEISEHGVIVGRTMNQGEFGVSVNVESSRIKFSVTKVVTVPADPYSDHIYPCRPRPR